MINFITYRQYDSRWGSKNYNGSSSMAAAGCGPSSVATIVYGVDGKTTPLDTMKYMQKHGYAIRNNGTAWNGIPACLKAFGVKDVQQVDKMSNVWSLMAKGYVGVFLFKAGSRGGKTYTTSGHYIPVTGYKVKDGKHYVYLRDPGARKNDGWHCYETQMKGLIPRIWLGYVEPPKPVDKPTGKYSGAIPTPTIKQGSSGTNVTNLQKFLNFYHPNWKLSTDGKAGAKTISALEKFQYAEGLDADGVYGKASQTAANKYKASTTESTTSPASSGQTYSGSFPTLPTKLERKAVDLAYPLGTPIKTAKYSGGKPKSGYKTALKRAYPSKKGWGDKAKAGASCDVFVGTCVVDSGIDKSFPRGLKGQKPHLKKSSKFKKVSKKQGGDIRVRSNHVGIVVSIKGKHYTANAHHNSNGGTYPIIQSGIKFTSTYRPSKIERTYLKKGDTFTGVKALKKFLNWAGYSCGTADYNFDSKTETAVKKFQSENGLSVTGKFDTKSLEKAKTLKR